MDDEKIIELFFARSETAIQELDTKYGKTCRKLSYNILKNRQDAEECINDAYFGVWNAIPPERPDPLLTFLCKIVRNISIKRYRTNTAVKRNSIYDAAMSEVAEYIISPENVEAEIETKALARVMEEFLDTLSVENRVIFLRRYWFADQYSDIARCVGMTEKNVSVRLARTRKQMREYLLERGFIV